MESLKSKYKFSSSLLSLLSQGKLFDLLTPWVITIDFDNSTIEVLKRNWYLVGVDKHIVAFKYIRSIKINEMLIGASIEIKVTGSIVKAECLAKSDCKTITSLLLENNKASKHIIFH